MARHRRRKHSWSPYFSEVKKYSIYPSYRYEEPDKIRPGDVIEVLVRDLDDKGRGIGVYRGKKIILYGGSVGSIVKARVSYISGDIIYAKIIKVLSDSGVGY